MELLTSSASHKFCTIWIWRQRQNRRQDVQTRHSCSAILQLFLQSFHLLLQLPKQSIFWILINARLVLYILRPVGITQGADRLVVVVVGGTQVCHLAWHKGNFRSSIFFASYPQYFPECTIWTHVHRYSLLRISDYNRFSILNIPQNASLLQNKSCPSIFFALNSWSSEIS